MEDALSELCQGRTISFSSRVSLLQSRDNPSPPPLNSHPVCSKKSKNPLVLNKQKTQSAHRMKPQQMAGSQRGRALLINVVEIREQYPGSLANRGIKMFCEKKIPEPSAG